VKIELPDNLTPEQKIAIADAISELIAHGGELQIDTPAPQLPSRWSAFVDWLYGIVRRLRGDHA